MILVKFGGSIMKIVSATEMKKNFGKYLQAVQDGDEIVILKHGKEIARLVSHSQNISFLTNSLIGVLSKDYSEDEIREGRYNRSL